MSMRNADPPPDLPSYHLFTQPTDPAVLAQRDRAWSGTDFSFHDLVDIINPLQHLPVIGTIYRYLTGDTIGAIPRIIGDTLYGGPVGFVSGLVDASLKKESGKDMGETMIAAVTGNDNVGSPSTGVAANADSTAPTTQVSQAGSATPMPAGTTVAAAAPSPAPAAAVGVPVSATVVGGPASVQSLAATTGRTPVPPLPAAATDNDPRAAFLARAEAMRRQYGGSGGVTPTNKVVPLQLQGVALPPGYSSQPPALKITAPGLPGAPSSSTPPIADASAATGTPATATSQPTPVLPTNPPVDVSQQMMDALDKYMRLQQQRDQGGQVNVVH